MCHLKPAHQANIVGVSTQQRHGSMCVRINQTRDQHMVLLKLMYTILDAKRHTPRRETYAVRRRMPVLVLDHTFRVMVLHLVPAIRFGRRKNIEQNALITQSLTIHSARLKGILDLYASRTSFITTQWSSRTAPSGTAGTTQRACNIVSTLCILAICG